MNERALRQLIKDIRQKRISTRTAFGKLKDLPFIDLDFAKLDSHRTMRKGFPEVVYAKGKTLAQLDGITNKLIGRGQTLMFTRADGKIFKHLSPKYPKLKFNQEARIIYYRRNSRKPKAGWVTIVTAGTSDIPVAEEAAQTLEVMSNKVRRIYDVGVAGIHRVLDKRKLLNNSRAVIVIAGMEGALASVIGGLTKRPVIAVPTSIGYGASFKGIAPLLTMLNSCVPGVTVVNIDNGFGAAYFANMIK